MLLAPLQPESRLYTKSKKAPRPRPGLQAALSIVQVAPVVQGGSINSGSVTFSSPVTAGNLIALAFGNPDSGGAYATPTSLGDGTNTYSFVRGDTGNGDFGTMQWSSIWYAKNVAAGTPTISISIPSSAGPLQWIIAAEIGGASKTSPLDTSGSASTGTSAAPSTSITTTNPSTLAFGVVGASFFAGTASVGAGFTLVATTNNGGDPALAEYQVYSSSGSKSVAAILGSSDQWLMSAVAFAAPGGGTADALFFGSGA
jgi:hypothetical protein